MNFLILSMIYFLNVLSRMLFPMLIPKFAHEYDLTSSGIGTLYLSLAIGFGLFLFFSQFISSKFSYQKVIRFSALSSGCLLILFPLVSSLSFFLFLLGALCGLFLPSSIAYLSTLYPEAKLGRTIGTFSAFQTAAMITAPLIGGLIDAHTSFKALFFILGLSLATFGILFELFAKSLPETGHWPSLDSFKEAVLSKANRTLFAFHTLAMGLNIGMYTAAPAYFIATHGISETVLFSLLSLSRIIGIFSSILCGLFLDFFGIRIALSLLLSLTGVFTLFLGLLAPNHSVFLFCIQGPLAVALTTLVYVAISKIAPPGRKASLISLFASASFLMGAGLIPQILGILGAWNLYPFGFILLGLASALTGLWHLNPRLSKIKSI